MSPFEVRIQPSIAAFQVTLTKLDRRWRSAWHRAELTKPDKLRLTGIERWKAPVLYVTYLWLQSATEYTSWGCRGHDADVRIKLIFYDHEAPPHQSDLMLQRSTTKCLLGTTLGYKDIEDPRPILRRRALIKATRLATLLARGSPSLD